MDDLDHCLMKAPGLAPNVRDHEAAMAKQPTQVPAIQVPRQRKRQSQQPRWFGWCADCHRLSLSCWMVC